MDRDLTINRRQGGEIPNVLAPLERGTPLKVFMRRVDWIMVACIAGFVAALLA